MALISRRALLSSVVLAGASVLARSVSQRGPWAQGTAPALVTSDSARPSIPYGVASGDVTSDAAIIWSRTNKPSRLLVEYATTDSFTHARRVQGPAALAVSDFTARVELTDLPAGQEIFYRVLLPTASTGIFGALVLGFGRALGETMALAMLVGNSNQLSLSLFSPANTLAALLALNFPEANKTQEGVLMYAAAILMAITLLVNICGATVLRRATANVSGGRK